jgi:branched-subunit amino acid aminotransferase/4-amino-4-deoxychorismate lyase
LKSYVRGRWLPVSKPAADRLVASTAFGGGLFTTLGVTGGQPLFLEQHLQRLAVEAEQTACPGVSSRRLHHLVEQAVLSHGLREGIIRLGWHTQAEGPRPFALCEPPRPLPARLILRVVHVEGPPLGRYAKSRHVLRWRSLQRQAAASGEFDVLVVRQDRLTETSRCNLFLELGDHLCTPPASEVFCGIARAALLADPTVATRVRPLALCELAAARRIVLANSVRGYLEASRVLDARGRAIWSRESATARYGQSARVRARLRSSHS